MSKQTHGFLYESKALDKSYRLYTPGAFETGETDVIKYINDYIKWVGEPIKLKVGKTVLENVYGVNKVNGTPKADISFVSYDPDRKKFEDAAFISHKMGSSATAFLRYGGISAKADGNNHGIISRHKEVLSFLKDLSAAHKLVTDEKGRLFRPITDKSLIAAAVYGPARGSSYNENNVNAVCQGHPIIRKYASGYVLSFTAGISENSDITKFNSGDYAAILEARPETNSSYEYGGKRYSGIRVSIAPKAVTGKTSQRI